MGLFTRRPQHLPLTPPTVDGAGWPEPSLVGRPTFASSTYYELGCRAAFEPQAHEVAERVVDALWPRLSLGVSEEDEPYLRKVFVTAARIGAGVGSVERGLATPDLRSIDRSIAGALLLARRKLPHMREDWKGTAAYFLLAGYYVARAGLLLDATLADELDRGAPGP